MRCLRSTSHAARSAAVLLAALCLPVAAGETLEERRLRIDSMPASQKQQLLRKADVFRKLDADEQQKVRKLESELSASADQDELRQIMAAYTRWLAELSPAQRAELNALPADQRLARITEYDAERRARAARTLGPEDLAAFTKWLVDWSKIDEVEKALTSIQPSGALPPQIRPQDRPFYLVWHALNRGPEHGVALLMFSLRSMERPSDDHRGHGRPPEGAPPSGRPPMQRTPGDFNFPGRERLDQLEASLSKPVADELRSAREARRAFDLLERWAFQAVQSHFQRRFKESEAQLTAEDAQKFLDLMPEPERARWLNLPPDQMRSRILVLKHFEEQGGAWIRRGPPGPPGSERRGEFGGPRGFGPPGGGPPRGEFGPPPGFGGPGERELRRGDRTGPGPSRDRSREDDDREAASRDAGDARDQPDAHDKDGDEATKD